MTLTLRILIPCVVIVTTCLEPACTTDIDPEKPPGKADRPHLIAQQKLSVLADVLDAHRVRQVPVMCDGCLVGMISRADLVRKLPEVKVAAPATRPDNGALQKANWHDIRSQPWSSATSEA